MNNDDHTLIDEAIFTRAAGKYTWCGGGPCFASAPGEAKIFSAIEGGELTAEF